MLDFFKFKFIFKFLVVFWLIGFDVIKWCIEKNRWKYWFNLVDSGVWLYNGVYVLDDVIRILYVFIKKKLIVYVEIIWKGKK